MWITETHHVSRARASTLWQLWQNVPEWKLWDDGLISSTLDGEFVSGGSGTLTPQGAPEALPFRLLEVVPERRFSDETELPGARLRFEHELEPLPEGTRITHRVRISGPAWAQYAHHLGADLERDLPHTVARLARTAEGLEAAQLESAQLEAVQAGAPGHA